MKTFITYIALAFFALAPSTSTAAPEIVIRAVAAKSGGVNEALLSTGSAVSLVDQAETGTITAPAFGLSVAAMDGPTKVNGTWVISSFTYSRWINGSPALDGNGNPLLDKPFGTFNAVGGAGPDIRGLTVTGTQSVGNGTATSGVTLNTTHSVLISQFVAPIDGSVRRPFLGAPGSNYTIEFRMSGTFNGVPFVKSATAMVIVGTGTFWVDINPETGDWSDGSSWIESGIAGEGGEDRIIRARRSDDGVGCQIVIIGVETSTDLVSWRLWDEEDGMQVSNLFDDRFETRLSLGGMSHRRFFRLRYQKVNPPSVPT